jgi:hypothetical protein
MMIESFGYLGDIKEANNITTVLYTSNEMKLTKFTALRHNIEDFINIIVKFIKNFSDNSNF